MIFNFLRQYLKDDEYEQIKTELAETRIVLSEYKNFIQGQRKLEDGQKEKVDADFLTLIWASIGFAFVVFGQSAKSVIDMQDKSTLPFYIWSAFTLFSLVFIFMNSIFALELTQKYALSKSNSGYITYARYVIFGAVLIVAGVLGLALIK
jgi:hypothetical protein